MPRLTEHRLAACRRGGCLGSSLVGVYASLMLPSPSRVTRLSGRGRSSVESQKSTAWRAMSLQRPVGRELRLDRLLAAVHRRLRLADHLDVAHRVVEVVGAEVEVVDAQGLLEDGRVRLAATGRAPPGCCGTCSCGRPDRSRWPVRWGGGRWPMRAAAWPCWRRRRRDDHDVGRVGLLLARRGSTTTSVTAVPAGVGLQPHHGRVGQQRDVRVLERGPDAEHLGVGLGVHEAGEAVADPAANARAVGHVRLVEHDRRTARGTGGSRRPRGRRRAAGCGARGRPPGTGRARWPDGSVGSSPRAPCTWYSCSACV